MKRVPVTLACILATAFGGVAARDLTFDERVAAQEAIERVHHAHQVGSPKPFEETVPRAVLQANVRAYLEESAALETIWHVPIGADALRGEVERMARDTKMPGRLREIFAALGDDTLLIQECLARPALVDRLARLRFAFDPEIHAVARRRAVQLREDLVAGRSVATPSGVRIATTDVVRVAENDTSGEPADGTLRLSPTEFERWRATVPRRVGEIGPIREMPEAYSVETVLEETADRVRVAVYVVPKRDWSEWWAENRARLAPLAVRSVASERAALPEIPRSDANTCPADAWLVGSRPTDRYGHVAVWTGSVVLMWGGVRGFDVEFLGSGGKYDPATDTWVPISMVGAPSARAYAGAVWTGSRMVVWGGVSGGVPLGTGGRYDPVTDTWTPTATLNAASPRGGHVTVWTGTEMIVWGGADNTNFFRNGARYNPVLDRWTGMSSSAAPLKRVGASAVWTGSRMIVWGGQLETGLLTDTGGLYDPVANQWSATSTVGAASPRIQHVVGWTGSLMLVWGGRSGDGTANALGDGARYDPVANVWTPIQVTNAPSRRNEASGVWTGSRFLVWGGLDPDVEPEPTAAGSYDPVANTWTTSSSVGAPAGRAGHIAVWTGTEMIIWGGQTDDLPGAGYGTDDGGRYSPATDSWSPVAPDGAPAGRSLHSSVWTGSSMLVWGGYNFRLGGALGTGGRYDPATDSWTVITTTGAPSARYAHLGLWTGNEMLIWSPGSGGRDDPAADSWLPISTVNAPADVGTRGVWTGTRMIVWGGNIPSDFTAGGRYDPGVDTWTPISVSGAPSARISFTAVWTGERMVVWGGGTGFPRNEVYNDGGRYDPATDTWTPTSTVGAPSPRSSHTATWLAPYMIVLGGDPFGGRYDPIVDAWLPVSTFHEPTGLSKNSTTSTGQWVVMWGGLDGDGDPQDTGAGYDPVLDAWTATSVLEAPQRRSWHSAIWTGESMIVWGGLDGLFVEINSGGAYAVAPFPGPVAGVVFADKNTLVWSPEPAAERYDVVRGDLATLRAGGGDFTFSIDACLEDDSLDATASDVSTPAPGAGSYYLVRAQSACKTGTYATGEIAEYPGKDIGIDGASNRCP